MNNANSPLNLMLDRLSKLSPLDEGDRAAILGLPFELRHLPSHEYLIREGDMADRCCLLMSGLVARHKMVKNGARQIVSLHIKGDIINVFSPADHSVEAITKSQVALICAKAVIKVAAERPAIAMAMWLDTTIDGAIFREWITNVGRRDAATRMAHILCEFGLRQESAGLGERDHFELPLTQSELGDALGLTTVHVNRILKRLEAAELIQRDRYKIRIPDWDKLSVAGDFDPSYLRAPGEAADA